MNPPDKIVRIAADVAIRSPCDKSKRGCVVFEEQIVVGIGWNHPPAPFVCNGSDQCRGSCGKLCVHAEIAAIMDWLRLRNNRPDAKPHDVDLLHVKVKGSVAVPSGPPSCWQCSRQVLDAKIAGVWLLHEDGWRRYTALEFHESTLQHHGLPSWKAEG